jgi:hypothetical protein
MAALIPKPDTDQPATSFDAAAPVRDTSPENTAASSRDALLRDLVRALARTAAREAWALA